MHKVKSGALALTDTIYNPYIFIKYAWCTSSYTIKYVRNIPYDVSRVKVQIWPIEFPVHLLFSHFTCPQSLKSQPEPSRAIPSKPKQTQAKPVYVSHSSHPSYSPSIQRGDWDKSPYPPMPLCTFKTKSNNSISRCNIYNITKNIACCLQEYLHKQIFRQDYLFIHPTATWFAFCVPYICNIV